MANAHVAELRFGHLLRKDPSHSNWGLDCPAPRKSSGCTGGKGRTSNMSTGQHQTSTLGRQEKTARSPLGASSSERWRHTTVCGTDVAFTRETASDFQTTHRIPGRAPQRGTCRQQTRTADILQSSQMCMWRGRCQQPTAPRRSLCRWTPCCHLHCSTTRSRHCQAVECD